MDEGDIEITSRSWWTLALTSVSVFMVSLETTIIALAFPDIGATFPESSPATLSWVFTAYNIGVASLLLVSGWLADAHGRRRMFVGGLLVFAIGSLGSGAAQSTEVLLAARSVQSIGGAMLYPASLALLLPAFPIQRRQMAVGIWAAMGGLAAALGPSLGGLLVDGFGWRAVFLVNIPVAILCAALAPTKIMDSKSEDISSGVDLIGTPLASLGVGALVLGIVQGEQWGWADGRIIASFALAIILLVVFVVRSMRHPAPLFDLNLFRIRSFTVGNFGGIFFLIAFFGWVSFMATYVQSVWGWSALKTGFAIAPGPLLTAFIAPVVGRLADRIGNKPILLVGGVSGAIGSVLLALTMEVEPNYVGVILPLSFFIGIAAGCNFPMLIGATMRDVPPNQFGTAGAVRTTIFNLGVAIGVAVAIASIGTSSTPEETLDGFRLSWFIQGASYAAMAIVFWFAFRNETGEEAASARRS